MNPKFQKFGIVIVGTAEPSQNINLQDPIGEVTEVTLDLKKLTMRMSVKACDDRNEVVREYPIQMDEAAWVDFFTGFFTNHLRRLSRDQYDEFKDLVQVVEE